MHSTAAIPRRHDRHPLALLLAILLVATGCGEGAGERAKEQDNDQGDVAREPIASQAAVSEVAPEPAPAAPVPQHLDRASLRVLGMT